jgi:hypothetical protein
MGAEFCTMTVKGENRKQAKSQFEAEQESDRYENGHSYSGGLGMADGLEFHEKKFSNKVEAEQYLIETCEKWGPAIAVTYQNPKGEINFLIGALCSC